jgi:beta-galactosidase/beta-glucuronidase
MTTPRPEHPRPDRFRPDWINLNGTWDFKFDPGKSGHQQNWQSGTDYDKKIVVPFCMESKLSGLAYKDFMPAVWYRRTFTIPENWKDKRVLLHFGACDHFTRVYVNSTLVGQHTGGYVSFSFDITSALKSGENTLVVEAQDDVRSNLQPAGKQCTNFASYACSYTRTTGIWQTVWLEAVPKTYIEKFKIFPDLDNARVSITVFPAGDQSTGSLDIAVKSGTKTIAKSSTKIANQSITLLIDLPEAHPWSPENPFLYNLEFTLKTPAGCDNLISYFGLRKIHIEGRKIFLNNKPLYMRTVLDQGFYPDGIYTAPTDEALKADIELSMNVGFNGARLHQKIFESRFLYWADKLGYIVWGEHASWECDFNNPLSTANFIDEWMQALDRDFNHPAIIGWCPLNETAVYMGKIPKWLHIHLYQLNKAMDPTRMAIDTSGYVHYSDVPSDLYDVHNYAMPEQLAKDFQPLLDKQWDKAFRNHSHLDIPYDGSKPYFNSEFGGIWWQPANIENNWGYGDRPKSEAEFIERYCKTTQIMLDNPEICGFCYTQLYDIEQEVNGLYYYDRTPKFSPELMAKLKQVNSAPAKYEQ